VSGTSQLTITRSGHALLELSRLEAQFHSGEPAALALAINIAGATGLPLPLWVARAWANACAEVFSAKVASWDDVLKSPRDIIKGPRQLAKARQKVALYERLQELVLNNPPTAINDDFFDGIAKKLNLTRAQVRKLYYSVDARFRPRPQRRSNSRKTASNQK
jgi:hypothetical protein